MTSDIFCANIFISKNKSRGIMNCLLSINWKFFKENPISLVDTVLAVSDVDGFEIGFDYSQPNDRNFATQFIPYVISKNLIISFHANHNIAMPLQKEYLDFIYSLTKNYSKKISVVYHSIYDKDKTKSLYKTREFFDEILGYIKEKKYSNIVLSIENLNELNHIKRLDKADIVPFVRSYENLYITYDIGHELYDYVLYNMPYVPLEKDIIKKVSNIHIHTFADEEDHHAIMPDCKYIDFLSRELKLLYDNGYSGDIVLEYGLWFFKDPTTAEQIISYAKTISIFRELFKKVSN